MKILFSHLKGNANVNAAVEGLLEAGLLEEFHVTIASFPGSIIDRIGGINALSEIRRRRFEPKLKPFTHTWPWLEMGRLLATKGKVKRLINHEAGRFSVDAVHQNLDRNVARHLKRQAAKTLEAVYCYEDAALCTFLEAKRLGLTCFYDLPIGYWRAARDLLKGEQERWPEWLGTMPGLLDSDEKLSRKDEELRLADRIFVASTFTANTIKYFPGNLAPVEVIPYGFPPVGKMREYTFGLRKRPLKVLFVGSLSQRKGIADLFAAVEALSSHLKLTLVGRKVSDNCPALDVALSRHTYFPSLSNPQILELMRDADLLIFPSLFEGFGLVITEAMSQGTPVITTERTAGPDLIKHGQNGWITKAGSVDALKAAIEEILYRPQSIAEAGKEALERASQRSWRIYGHELASAIQRKAH